MANRLAGQTSPYLLQHADNPVDWQPWEPEAFALARSGDRLILLSVGYSACHWCHVMAHECFEDEETAALMNRHFVNIKVDREERPDIDQIYQTAHRLLTGRAGGWPLTMFLTPDGKPLLGGTYFPKRPRFGLTGFDDLLQRVADAWGKQREQLQAHGDALVAHLAATLPRAGGDGEQDPDRSPASTAAKAAKALRAAAMQSFDPVDGGFGGAPKFPQPSTLQALLREAVAADDIAARDAVLLTLRRMAEGGLVDHLGGGFFRYSTDARWAIPHFEKMLYDNGQLLRHYAHGWQIGGEALFRQVCESTAEWLIREMQSPDGGYFSSVDADAGGVEGSFYVWQRDEIARRLTVDEFAAFAARYGIDAEPNFEHRDWHLNAAVPVAKVAAAMGRPVADAEALIEAARSKLFALRETRARPGRDDKVLTAWNALAADGMAFAARVFGAPRWADSARRAVEFIAASMRREGRLLAAHKDGRSHLNAYLDDHAFMLAAVLELMQGDVLRAADLRLACELADSMIENFEDTRDGGFFFTRHDHEALVLRPKSGNDNAIASGNAVAALCLQRLGHLVGDPRYGAAARKVLALFGADAERVPLAYPTLVTALAESDSPPALVILCGPQEATSVWRVELAKHYLPGVITVQLDGDTAVLPSALARPTRDRPQAWVCRGTNCLPPVEDLASLLRSVS
jgi:uncharacterized protein